MQSVKRNEKGQLDYGSTKLLRSIRFWSVWSFRVCVEFLGVWGGGGCVLGCVKSGGRSIMWETV